MRVSSVISRKKDVKGQREEVGRAGRGERKRRKRERKRGREDAKNSTDVRSPSGEHATA